MTSFEHAGLSAEWAHQFVVHSNLIDPQPGENAPGSPLYDLHHAALEHAVAAANGDRFALPRDLHIKLLPNHPLAGLLRKQPSSIGFRAMLQPTRVPFYTWRWNADAREYIGALRCQDSSSAERQDLIWDLHCELMNIRPFEMYNGRVGRLLLVNHALLLGEQPYLVEFADRDEYLAKIGTHMSASWADQPVWEASTGSDREG